MSEYIWEIDVEYLRLMQKSSRAVRKQIAGRDFKYFALYYFPEFFIYEAAPFHLDMYEDLHKLGRGDFQYLVWVMFRESAKTSIAKMYATWCVCFKKKRYINFDSYEKENAEAALFDIAVWFQTNKRIIKDFGQLYWEEKLLGKKVKVMKRLNTFITTNKVKFEAFSTQESTRGRIYNHMRPDLFVLDDIETFKTKRSSAITQGIIQHVDEMMAGLAPNASVLFLGNYITESGVVGYLMSKAREDPKFRLRQVNATDRNGKPSWPDKYTKTDAEAAKVNKKIQDPDERKVSLESKKRTLNSGGRRVYEVEMENDPEASGELVFDRKKIDELAKDCKPPDEDKAGFKLWDVFNPKHRYAIGADTAKGVGRDSNASAIVDFTRKPAVVVGTYANNMMSPDVFGHELKRQGEMFGTCLVAPEINNTGYATTIELKGIYPIEKIFARNPGKTIKQIDKPGKMLGWETNGATKGEMMYQLKSAIEDGHLKVYDKRVLDEARRYNQADLEELNQDPESTRHFDLLTALAIAWAMRNHAMIKVEGDESMFYSKQKPYQGMSQYENTGTRPIQIGKPIGPPAPIVGGRVLHRKEIPPMP